MHLFRLREEGSAVSVPKFTNWTKLPAGIGGARMAWFTLTAPLNGHTIGCIVNDRTLLQHGYDIVQLAALVKVSGEPERVE